MTFYPYFDYECHRDIDTGKANLDKLHSLKTICGVYMSGDAEEAMEESFSHTLQ